MCISKPCNEHSKIPRAILARRAPPAKLTLRELHSARPQSQDV